MYDVHSFETGNPPDELGEDAESFKLGQALMPGDVVSKISSLAVLQKNIKVALGFLDVNEIDNPLAFALAQ